MADPSAPAGVSLRDVPSPTPGPGVASVTVVATSLNRGEVQHVRNYRRIPDGERVGWDLAGIVKEPATDGTGPVAGTAVFGWCRERGSWAEEVAVPISDVAQAPAGLTAVDASTLGVAALTAHEALELARRPLRSASVLVTGSTGGVGLFAVQLARLAGATVIASVRRAEDAAQVLREVGDPDGVEVEVGLDSAGEPVDLVLETVGGDLLSAALERVAPGGTVVSIGRTDPTHSEVPAGWFLKGARLDGLSIGSALPADGGAARALAAMGELVARGRLRTGVQRVVPATQMPAAMEALMERRVRGKVVLTWAGDGNFDASSPLRLGR